MNNSPKYLRPLFIAYKVQDDAVAQEWRGADVVEDKPAPKRKTRKEFGRRGR